jgi:hypothetical protein
MNAALRGWCGCVALFSWLAVALHVPAQPAADQASTATNSPADQITALQLELTNAWHQVETIVNQPVPAFRRAQGYRVSVFSPGWFHPGAMTPDFNNVDVRQSQELAYTNRWVSSDITPGLMFNGDGLEFNAMTKLFYTNRSLPKKRLTEAEMLQINSLYRTIGHCQAEIGQLQNPAASATATPADANDTAPAKALAAVSKIPQPTRILYGGIAIGALLVLVVALRFIRKKPD